MSDDNLPTGTQVHENDPAEQTFLVGMLIAEVTIAASCEIQADDEIESEDFAARKMLAQIHNSTGGHKCLRYEEINIRPIKFEPD